MGIKNRDAAESAFKQTIAGIASQKRNQKGIRKWAQLLADTESWPVEKQSNIGKGLLPVSKEILYHQLRPAPPPPQNNCRGNEVLPALLPSPFRANKAKPKGSGDDDAQPAAQRQRYCWLDGPGDTETKTFDTGAQWVHDGMDISARFRSHRDDIIAKAFKEDLSNDTDQLCLNYIFYFPQNKNDGIWRIFDEELRRQLAKELEHDDCTFMPNEALLLCLSINKDVKLKKGPTDTLLDFRFENRNNSLLQGFARALEQV
ncbi:hypothetical protein BJV82DRAFT_662623 [Fennellomyces sp. T-0311]|nr:hypothetical protein BJV82DRAFT_662623 [Fennellomyces sp. T-0311]